MAIKMRTCGECALAQHNGGICPIFKEAFPSDAQACPKFTTNVVNCALCGNLFRQIDTLVDITHSGPLHSICAQCHSQVNHCPTCKHNKEQCLFETDPSDIPKVIQQQIRQGNMIQIATVKNPSRIEITCKKGCPCYSEDFECGKQITQCGNWKMIYDD